MSCLNYPDTIRGEVGTKTFSVSNVMCPSLLPDFDRTCTRFGAWEETAICYIGFTPL
jgi:hypothetical protein